MATVLKAAGLGCRCPTRAVNNPLDRTQSNVTPRSANRSRGAGSVWRVEAAAERSSRGDAKCDGLRAQGQPFDRRQLLSAASLATVAASGEAHASYPYLDESKAVQVFDASQRSVVSLADYLVVGGEEKVEGVGSGFVWDKMGHIITNYHCVARLAKDLKGTQVTKVELLQADGSNKTYVTSLVGYDQGQDLAVLRIDAPAEELAPIKIGTSGDLKVGQSVFAIGNPFGLSHTLTSGCVSGLNRTIPAMSGDRIFGTIQTDASISSGNSGGPLFDTSGRCVGINTATFTRRGSGRSSGVNFAVPIDTAMRIVPNIIVKKEA